MESNYQKTLENKGEKYLDFYKIYVNVLFTQRVERGAEMHWP